MLIINNQTYQKYQKLTVNTRKQTFNHFINYGTNMLITNFCSQYILQVT